MNLKHHNNVKASLDIDICYSLVYCLSSSAFGLNSTPQLSLAEITQIGYTGSLSFDPIFKCFIAVISLVQTRKPTSRSLLSGTPILLSPTWKDSSLMSSSHTKDLPFHYVNKELQHQLKLGS